MITTTGKGNYATSIFDQRTKYSRDIAPRSLNIASAMQEIETRPAPVYEVDDTIRLEDGTERKIVYRTYSTLQRTWLYRINTDAKNRYGGTLSSGNLTEQQVIDMDKLATTAVDSHKFADGWIVEYTNFLHNSEVPEFHTWKNDDGTDAVFDKEIAIQFAQGMVMAYDFHKRWAIFRVSPVTVNGQEPHWFFTLIQPDGNYTAALSAFAELRHFILDIGFLEVGLAKFYEDDFPTRYSFNRIGSYFVRRVIENWRKEYVTDSCTGYSNPNRPKFNVGEVLKLPTGFIRPVQFITPYWVNAGQVGFRYWFYIQGKQLVDYAQDGLSHADVEVVEVELPHMPKTNVPLATFAQNDLSDQVEKPECILAKMQKNIDFQDHTINRLKDVLTDIEKACKNLSVGLDDDFSWIGYMANMGLNGGYYSDGLKARFGLVPKPQHTIPLSLRDEL